MADTADRRTKRQRTDYDESELEVHDSKDAAAGATAVAVSMKRSLERMGPVRTAKTLLKLNQADGFDCMSCAWPDPDPKNRHTAEFCENGAKAVAEEATKDRATPEFFAEHSIADLDGHSELWLGQQGRITHPMVKRPGGTHYEPIEWDDAFGLIAEELNALENPDEATFYTSGRTSNEAAFAYQLFVRAFGTNNLPDCSNMCHESTSVALAESIGIGKASVVMQDVYDAELIVILGQNPGTNHPRMLSALEIAKGNGATIVAVNPLNEAGSIRFKNPQTPKGMTAGTPLSDLHLPIKVNGDLALLQALGSLLVEWDALDHDFIARHTERLRGVEGARPRGRLGRRRHLHGSHPRADHPARRDAARLRPHGLLLGDGPDPAPQRRGHHQGDRQPGLRPGQPGQARRRTLPGARPLQRAGRPDHGDLGATAGALPRRSAEGVRVRPAPRPRDRRRRLHPRHARRHRQGLRGPRRQLRPGHARTPTSPSRRCVVRG